jgi:hypothetical protein
MSISVVPRVLPLCSDPDVMPAELAGDAGEHDTAVIIQWPLGIAAVPTPSCGAEPECGAEPMWSGTRLFAGRI